MWQGPPLKIDFDVYIEAREDLHNILRVAYSEAIKRSLEWSTFIAPS